MTQHPIVRRLTFSLVVCLLCSSCGESPPETSPPAAISVDIKTDSTGWPFSFGFGSPAAPERIASWDIDVRPDGEGLPSGSGTAVEGESIYRQKCAACHGATGTEGPNDRLVGRLPNNEFPFSDNWETWDNKTIGTYWPYATTLWDYIYRAMPQDAPGSLSPNEVYAVTAFLLHSNDIIPGETVMSAETLPRVEMPARDRFMADDRLKYQEVR